MPSSGSNPPSFLLVEEYFDQEDDRFLDALRQPHPPAMLAGFADRWKKDPRAWARRHIFAYLDRPLDVPGHHPVVKRLFKHAEASGDHELMGAFLHVFDCLVRRVRKRIRRWKWDSQTGRSFLTEEEQLTLPPNSIRPATQRRARNPRTGREVTYVDPASHWRPGAKLFSYPTRRYLRRRAWRYFRHLAHRRPDEYRPAIAAALARFDDAELQRGEDLLESWGLMNACFHQHDALEFKPHRVIVRQGRRLSELSAAPYLPEVWQAPEACAILLELLAMARARCVRTWARQLLERDHKERIAQLSADELLRLLSHNDEEVQQFGARLLGSAVGAAAWPVETWLQLLETEDAAAISLVCEAMQRHVRAERLDLAQSLALATAKAAPVARMGLAFLQQRSIASPAERRELAVLGKARCAAIGEELARWALSVVGTRETYGREVVVALLDSLLAEVRRGAWEWLQAGPPVPEDPVLWCRLLETPFDDLRLGLIDHLQHKASLPGIGSKDLAPVWSAVLVGVHRGGRQKLKAVQQIAEAVCRHPEQVAELLPVLVVAVRSIRQPEFRAAMAAIGQIADCHPDLEPRIAAQLPELKLTTPAILTPVP